jgi:uncharacterized membrane protein
MILEIGGYILLAIVVLWFLLDIIFPLACRAFIALLRWYIQKVVNG